MPGCFAANGLTRSQLSTLRHLLAPARRPVGLLLLSSLCAVRAPAQHTTPQLLQRHVQATGEDSGVFRPGQSNLPDEAAGAYALSPDSGEIIEMILNGGGSETRLQGYLTRIGDGPSDRGASLTFFFARSTVTPTQLTFVTRQVHGVWWSFAGSIDRGSAQMSTQKGYYFLNGMLTEHFDTGQSQARRISLPSLPDGRSSP